MRWNSSIHFNFKIQNVYAFQFSIISSPELVIYCGFFIWCIKLAFRMAIGTKSFIFFQIEFVFFDCNYIQRLTIFRWTFRLLIHMSNWFDFRTDHKNSDMLDCSVCCSRSDLYLISDKIYNASNSKEKIQHLIWPLH